jgi:hypothetical protein
VRNPCFHEHITERPKPGALVQRARTGLGVELELPQPARSRGFDERVEQHCADTAAAVFSEHRHASDSAVES